MTKHPIKPGLKPSFKPSLHGLLVGAGITALSLSIAIATAQAQTNDSILGPASDDNHYIATPAGWQHPMTPWGDPDIQATLDMMQASRVPLERCASSYSFGGPACDFDKKWLTDAEYDARIEAWSNQTDRSTQLAADGDYGAAIQAGISDPNRPQRQTNLIVNPSNGLLPALTAEGKRRALTMRSDWPLPGEELVFNSAEDFDSWDRCITRGMPSSMMPYRYNGGFIIRQSPGYVILDLEMIHEARVIPIDSNGAIDSDIKQWLGDSRGHWEGNTLVIETTNYKEGPPMINLAVVGSPPGNRFPISEQMKTIERITRLNDDSWLYEITTEDPVILTESFTVRYPMQNDPNYWWSEYACHEDNVIVQNFTETSRYALANPTPEPPQPPVAVSGSVADVLSGRWVGRPQIATIDVDIELEFTLNDDGTVQGNLIGTNLGAVNKPLRNFRIEDRLMNFTMPNTTPWSFSGEVSTDGSIIGVVNSIQGGAPIIFTRVR